MIKVYLDTSVIIALANQDDEFNIASRNFLEALRQNNFLALIGPPLFLEVAKAVEKRGTESGRSIIETLEKEKIEQENVTAERIFDLADHYAKNKLLGERFTFDLLHYASATLLGCRYLASWDKSHFNSRTAARVNELNRHHGLTSLIVGDPRMVVRDIQVG